VQSQIILTFSVLVFAPPLAVHTPDQGGSAPHTNFEIFCLDAKAYGATLLMQCSETQWAFGTIDYGEHFSLAKTCHLAIMSLQLGKVWGVRSYE